jgi:hypothetical protein
MDRSIAARRRGRCAEAAGTTAESGADQAKTRRASTAKSWLGTTSQCSASILSKLVSYSIRSV